VILRPLEALLDKIEAGRLDRRQPFFGPIVKVLATRKRVRRKYRHRFLGDALLHRREQKATGLKNSTNLYKRLLYLDLRNVEQTRASPNGVERLV
jgi:hypothetical protein